MKGYNLEEIKEQIAQLNPKVDSISEGETPTSFPKNKYGAVGIISFKAQSERIPRKNLREIGGKPLYYHAIKKALASNLDSVFVITDADFQVKEEIRKMGAEILEIPDYYFGKAITGDRMLSIPAEKINAEIYVQLFITAPFMSVETINKTIEVLEGTDYDSLFTVNSRNDWVWYNGKPITYFPGNLPRSQDAVPIVTETTAIYAMKREALKEYGRRIGNKPYMLEVDEIEGLDIDNPIDFLKAEIFYENMDKIKAITGKDYGKSLVERDY